MIRNKLNYFLVAILLLYVIPTYANNRVLCPRKVFCKTTHSKSCKPLAKQEKKNNTIQWRVDPGPTSQPLTPGNYFLVSANTDKALTPASCVYMSFVKRAKSTFVVLISSKALRPLKTKKTRWSFVNKSWVCPNENNYKKIKPSLCAFFIESNGVKKSVR